MTVDHVLAGVSRDGAGSKRSQTPLTARFLRPLRNSVTLTSADSAATTIG
ncbi:hypothetical protein AB0L53_48215 [Nonomuraea sp. NPDC052129]